MRPNIETTKPPTRTRKPAEVSRDTSLPTPPAEDAAPAVWAQYLAEIGRLTGAVKVFLCGDNNKKPRRVGWQAEASNDPETIKAWWAKYPNANIGLAIQPGFGVLDVDLYKPGAREKLEAFEAEHGKLPATLEFCTARGGRHLVYVTSKNFGNSAGSRWLPARLHRSSWRRHRLHCWPRQHIRGQSVRAEEAYAANRLPSAYRGDAYRGQAPRPQQVRLAGPSRGGRSSP
jgi:hypothetical protein